jgi:hypothetical protein
MDPNNTKAVVEVTVAGFAVDAISHPAALGVACPVKLLFADFVYLTG